jgi:acetylornithine/N-succinyldiaminopimelate aminotransferase
MNNKIAAFDAHVMQTYGRLPIMLEKGIGATLTDVEGKAYIDFGSGIGVNALGYGDGDWVAAVSNAAANLAHVSNYYYTEAGGQLAAKLCELTGQESVFFCNSGAEANECAIKLARKYSFDKYGKGRETILTIRNSFHGRTVATLSATGQDDLHNYFFPFVEGFIYAEPDAASLKKALEDQSVCAVMFEYIRGEGGVEPLDQALADVIFAEAERRDLLTIADEVQTGIGRTGKFAAGEYYNKKADIMTFAKGLAGGLPIGACLAGQKCAKTLTKGTHGSTFGGNPIAAAGALVVLDKVVKLLPEVKRKGEYIRSKLSAASLENEIQSISGEGLMLGLTLKNKNAGEVLTACVQKGLLVLTAKAKVRIMPPLVITNEELDKGLSILTEVLES